MEAPRLELDLEIGATGYTGRVTLHVQGERYGGLIVDAEPEVVEDCLTSVARLAAEFLAVEPDDAPAGGWLHVIREALADGGVEVDEYAERMAARG